MSGVRLFKVGDIVTRDGIDRQRILQIHGGGLMTVECIKEPLGFLNEDGSRDEPWCKIGDREDNFMRRYCSADDGAEPIR